MVYYFIDGYNLMFRLLGADGELQDKRDKFIHSLNAKVAALEINATIVFDAHYQVGERSRKRYSLEVVFTQEGETADDYILTELDHSPKPTQVTVVTSDKRLAWQCRRRSAKTESIEEFLAWFEKRYKRKSKSLKQKPVVKPKRKEAIEEIVDTPLSAEECFDYYLKAFEKELELSEQVIKKPKKTAKIPKRKVKEEKRQEKGVSVTETWIKAFEREENDWL